jgi:HEAT repeat protein
MIERFNIPLRPQSGKDRATRRVLRPGKRVTSLLLILATLSACTSVTQMQTRYEAGDDTQLEKIATIAARPDYPYATRRTAAKALGEIGDARVLPVLVGILGEFDQRTTLKKEALLALGRIGDQEAVTGIGRLLDRSLSESNEELRMAAMPVLGQLGGEEAATILVNALTYYDLIMVNTEGRVQRGVFTGDEQSIRDLQDSLRTQQRRQGQGQGGQGQGELSGYGGGAFGTPSSLFGGNLTQTQQQKVDPTPQERLLAHKSLVRVGTPAVTIIQEHMSKRRSTITLRNELVEIMQEIQGKSPAELGSEPGPEPGQPGSENGPVPGSQIAPVAIPANPG